MIRYCSYSIHSVDVIRFVEYNKFSLPKCHQTYSSDQHNTYQRTILGNNHTCIMYSEYRTMSVLVMSIYCAFMAVQSLRCGSYSVIQQK